MAVDGLSAEACGRCEGVKYLPVLRGAFPPVTREPTAQMVKTQAFFGSGASAYRQVLISRNLAQALATAKVRGASVWPVAERPATR